MGIFLLLQLNASAQERKISGTITGINNDPLMGVTIVVKGTTMGTLSDMNGKFTLPIPSTAKTLAFSFIGMISQEVEIGASNVYNIVLSESLQNLDEVVVVGYGTQKKISVTGAVVSVGTVDLVKSPNATITNTLAGRVTGLATVQYTGQPGGDDPSIYVRGIGSLSASASTPLMLVDGVERSFTQIDPNEVESISVLKDASATAVYGIRGANGVIIVTTKRGVEGAPKISFTASTGLQVPTRLVQMSDSYQYATVFNAAQYSDSPTATLKFSPAALEAFRTHTNPLIYPNTDWVNYLTKPSALQSQDNFNISGGSKIVKYFASLGYLNQEGLFKTFGTPSSYGLNYKRYNYRVNVDINMTKSTIFSISIGGRSEARQSPGSAPSWTSLYWAVPYSGQMYEGKRMVNDFTYIGGTENYDGLNAIGYGSGYTRSLTSVINLDISLQQKLEFVTKGLSWRFKASNNSTSGQSKTRSASTETYAPLYNCNADPTAIGDSTIVFRQSGSNSLLGYSEGSSKSRNWYLETALAYNRDFGSHHVTGLLLYNESKSFYPGTYSDIPTGYVGIASRGTYNYQSKYMAEINLGYNGSENFAPGHRFGFFPAYSLGWVVSEEPFLKDKISFLNSLKFRYSFGVVGNDQLGGSRFLYLADSYSANSFVYGNSYSFGTNTTLLQPVASEGNVGNPFVTWERAKKQNIGVDITLFKKISFTADYFYENRNNILTKRNTVPSVLAFSLPAMNIGRVENRGYELELKYTDHAGNFFYHASGNMSFARNKILYMDEIPKNEPYLVQTGRSVGQPFGYVFDAFWTDDDITHLSDFADASYTPKAGDARYKDLNSDGKINSDDQMPIGYPDQPEYIFSFSGGAEYRGFDLSFLWTGATNVSRILNDTWRVPFQQIGTRALLKWLAENSWTPETATTALAPRITFSGRQNNTQTSNLWIKSASYLRLKNLEFGYTFNKKFLKQFGISKVRIYTNGYDLLTFDKLKFIDPEQRTSSPDYPLIKIYNFGINVDF